MSGADIEKGTRWSSDIAKELKDSRVGIICLTPGNLDAPWIYFEAGALSKTIENTYVCPYLFNLRPTEIPKGPLVQFQAAVANKGDTKRLVQTVNSALEKAALPESQLDTTFEVWWPKLEEDLKKIPGTAERAPARTDRDILEEILAAVRSIGQPLSHLLQPWGTRTTGNLALLALSQPGPPRGLAALATQGLKDEMVRSYLRHIDKDELARLIRSWWSKEAAGSGDEPKKPPSEETPPAGDKN
jgi:hypothetical protein